MPSFKELHDYIVASGCTSERLDEEGLQAYGAKDHRAVYVVLDSVPLRVSLRCRPELAKHLAKKYESIMPGHELDPKKWITILDTGQLSEQEIFDLIDQSIALATSDN